MDELEVKTGKIETIKHAIASDSTLAIAKALAKYSIQFGNFLNDYIIPNLEELVAQEKAAKND